MTPTPVKIQGYGWRRDRPDPRDRLFNLEEPIEQGHSLPATWDLEPEMPPIYDQRQLGSCTANAAAALLQHRQTVQGEPEGQKTPSRLFVYYEERRIESLPLDQDTGAEVRDGIKVLATEGAPPEDEWPYDDANPGPFQRRPPDSAFADALRYEAVAYQRIVIGGPGAPMRTAISRRQPIAFGFPVPALFEDPAWDPAKDYLPLPNASTQFIGGHAVVVVGYDFSLRHWRVPVFKVRNSWGPNWGARGHFWVDFRWFDPGRQLADDLWVVQTTT